MNPLKWLRKIGKFVRGGATPAQILLACIFGTMLGLVPGFNMVHLTLMLLLLTLNVSIGLAILSFAIGKALMLPLAPLTADLGRWVIEDIGISGLFTAAGDTPILALMNLYIHCVTGGILLSIALGAMIGFLVARVVLLLRRGLVRAGEKSPRVARLAAAWPVKVILFLLFGRQKKPLAELLSQKSPILRKWGIAVALVLLALVVGGSMLLVDYYLAGKIEAQLGRANGAEVNIGQVDLALWRGRARLVDIQFTDPADPTRNRFEADEITLDISIRGLLAKRTISDQVVVPGAVVGGKRETPGQVYQTPEPDESQSPKDLFWTWLKDPEKIKETFDRLKTYKEWFDKIRERIGSKEEGEIPPPDPNAPLLERSSRHLLTRHPTLLIREIRVESIRFGDQPVEYRLLGRNISTHPELVDGKMTVAFEDVRKVGDEIQAGKNTHAILQFDFRPGRRHHMDLLLTKIPIGQTFQLSEKSPVRIDRGLASFEILGGFSASALDLTADIRLRDFQAGVRSGREVLGFQAATVERILSRAGQIPLVMHIGGTLTRPTATVDQQATKQAFQKMLPNVLQDVLGNEAGRLLDGWIRRQDDDDADEEDDGRRRGGLEDWIPPL
jgi:uncharacterized protein (TIGR03546 family)